MVPLGSVCSEDDDVDENYVPMSAATTEPPVAPRWGENSEVGNNSYWKYILGLKPLTKKKFLPCSRVPPAASTEPSVQDANYVAMTPLPVAGEHATLGRQVPPPAHMGFRNSPLTPIAPPTPPLRRNSFNTTSGSEVEATPPPIHRNLKPQRKGQWWIRYIFGISRCCNWSNILATHCNWPKRLLSVYYIIRYI